MLRPFFVLTLVSTILAAASCGDDGSATSSSSTPNITIDQACATLTDAVCAKLGSCSAFALEFQFGDEAACKDRINIQCTSTFDAKGSTTGPAYTEACGKAFSGLSCDDLFSDKTPAECDFPAGTLVNGEACGREVQCASKHCNKQQGACGACGEPIPAGGTCKITKDCEDGLTCAKDKCVPPGDSGATCDAATPCKNPLVCAAGTCAVPAGAGEACDPLASTCDLSQGLACNAGKVCQKLKLAAPGEACGTVGSDYVLCKANGTCKLGAGMSGTCLAAAEDGANCDPVMGPMCKAAAFCTGGVCKLDNGLSCN